MTKNAETRLERKQVVELLTAVFTLCSLDSTLTSDVLDPLIKRSRALAKKRVAKLSPQRKVVVDLDVLGHVVYIWQRTPSYLDNNGEPLPIPARGPAPSIQALFKDVRRAPYFDQGLKHLVRVKRVRKLPNGRYLPCSEVTIVDGMTPELGQLLSETMNRLLSTVIHNTSQRDDRTLRLIERVTTVPDLPSKQVRAFKTFAREQGGALINTMNEWLESRRGNRKARVAKATGNLTAGLHVFAFVEKNQRSR
ncbi:MAG TPA: DUF6502 family protein [Vicinamibacterales bacterium]|nr:DUF6502 family protein [Vicinamibacterales bacterium]